MINCTVWCDPAPDPLQVRKMDELYYDGRWNDRRRHDDHDGPGLTADRDGAGAFGDRTSQIHPLGQRELKMRQNAK